MQLNDVRRYTYTYAKSPRINYIPAQHLFCFDLALRFFFIYKHAYRKREKIENP